MMRGLGVEGGAWEQGVLIAVLTEAGDERAPCSEGGIVLVGVICRDLGIFCYSLRSHYVFVSLHFFPQDFFYMAA